MNGSTYALIASLLIPAVASAEAPSEGELRITPILKLTANDKAFNDAQVPMAGKLVLVTIRVDNKLYLQTELTIQRQADWFKVVKLPAGDCEVTFQGEGLQMIIKRGVRIAAGESTLCSADLLAGKGLLVIDENRDVQDVQYRAPSFNDQFATLNPVR